MFLGVPSSVPKRPFMRSPQPDCYHPVDPTRDARFRPRDVDKALWSWVCSDGGWLEGLWLEISGTRETA
jgi:hypothetical protein